MKDIKVGRWSYEFAITEEEKKEALDIVSCRTGVCCLHCVKDNTSIEYGYDEFEDDILPSLNVFDENYYLAVEC